MAVGRQGIEQADTCCTNLDCAKCTLEFIVKADKILLMYKKVVIILYREGNWAMRKHTKQQKVVYNELCSGLYKLTNSSLFQDEHF